MKAKHEEEDRSSTNSYSLKEWLMCFTAIESSSKLNRIVDGYLTLKYSITYHVMQSCDKI